LFALARVQVLAKRTSDKHQEQRDMAKRIEYINPRKACPPQGLYSHVTRVSAGTLYFVAGQLAVDRNGKVAGKHDFARQFRQVFDNLEARVLGFFQPLLWSRPKGNIRAGSCVGGCR
jgi:hypothetical protein